MSTRLVVLDPRQRPSARVVSPAARARSLAGKRLGLLWNNRPGGDRLLKSIGEALHEKYGLAEVYFTRKTFIGNAAPPEIIDELVSRVDAAVVGLGD